MAYPLFNFARLLLGFPFGFQIGVPCNLSDLLLNGSLRFVKAALELVFCAGFHIPPSPRSEEHTSELQSPCNLVCRLLLEKKNTKQTTTRTRTETIHR